MHDNGDDDDDRTTGETRGITVQRIDLLLHEFDIVCG